MIRVNGIKGARIIRPADENGHVHAEHHGASGHPIIESVHVSRLRWHTTEEETTIFGTAGREPDAHHMPGPWWMKRGLLGGYQIFSRLRHIATVRPVGSPHERRATARLVATAPELLSILNEVEVALRRNAVVYEEHKALLQRARGLVFRIRREE